MLARLAALALCLALAQQPAWGFVLPHHSARTGSLRLKAAAEQMTTTGSKIAPEQSSSSTATHDQKRESYVAVPGSFRPSIVDKARTIAHVCTSGTLCTTSVMDDAEGSPFGSYVDYVLDENGWPVLLLSAQSLHTININKSPLVSLFAQLPRAQSTQTTAALSRVTIMGEVVGIDKEELSALRLAFTLAHPYAEQIVDSPKFAFQKIKPRKIYFSGGFGVMATWVDVTEYQSARPDVLASEVSAMLSKINLDKQGELQLLCKHFLKLEDVDSVKLQAIDRLGVDLRVKTGEYTDEYRIGFRHVVSSSEDAKSELVKLFQECWERDNGYWSYTGVSADDLPPVHKYAEDILRAAGSKTGFSNGDNVLTQ